jgi:hypothetical protein
MHEEWHVLEGAMLGSQQTVTHAWLVCEDAEMETDKAILSSTPPPKLTFPGSGTQTAPLLITLH